MDGTENFVDALAELIVNGDIGGIANVIQAKQGINLDLSKSIQGEPVLSIAIKAGKYDIVKMLVERKYEKKALDMILGINGENNENKTVIMEACDYGNDSMLWQVPGRKDSRDRITKFLLEKANASDIMSVDVNGLTPMMYACRSGNVVAVENLLDRLAKLGKSQDEIKSYLNQTDDYGHTACEFVYIEDRTDIERLLNDRGYKDVLYHARVKLSDSYKKDVSPDAQTEAKTPIVRKIKKLINKKSRKKDPVRKGSVMYPDYLESEEYLNDSKLDLLRNSRYSSVSTTDSDKLQDTVTLVEEEPDIGKVGMVSSVKDHVYAIDTIVDDSKCK